MKRTTKPKALWYRAKQNKPQPKQRSRIRPVSKRRAKVNREYAARVREWKKGKECICCGLFKMLPKPEGLIVSRPICSPVPHLCDDNHHSRGRVGSLLMDERFWIPVCRTAHNWIQNNPEDARALGLLCKRGEWNKPLRGKED